MNTLQRIHRFYLELKRRSVFKVAAAYLAVAFILLQVASLTFDPLGLPEWAYTLVVVLFLLGFPPAVLLAWAYDITPAGIQPATRSGDAGAEGRPDPEDGPRAAPLPRPVSGSAREPGSGSPAGIAVLPFANLGPGDEADYFSDGITEEIIACLCRLRGLKVISRTSSMQYKGATRNVRDIARELGVANVLEGSVRRAGDRVRIAAQLVDALEDRQLWGEIFDRRIEDVFAIQSEVARAIAAALQAELDPEEHRRLQRRPPRNPEAYDRYLQARHAWALRTEESLLRAVELLRSALDLDPAFAPAHAALAEVHVTLALYGTLPPDRVMEEARAAAARALEADDRSAEALTARAVVRAAHDWDWAGAEADLRLALQANPQYATAHQWLATNVLIPLGRFDEAEASLRTAAGLDPLSPAIAASAGVLDYYRRRPAEGAAHCRHVLERHPGFPLALVFLGLCLEAMGEYDDAEAALRRVLGLPGWDREARAYLAHAVGRRDPGEARALVDELRASADAGYVSPTLLAIANLGAGERDEALHCLERARDGRAADLIWLAVRPTFDPLRGEPRFRALLETLGLERVAVPA